MDILQKRRQIVSKSSVFEVAIIAYARWSDPEPAASSEMAAELIGAERKLLCSSSDLSYNPGVNHSDR